jgi:hypothetical protein
LLRKIEGVVHMVCRQVEQVTTASGWTLPATIHWPAIETMRIYQRKQRIERLHRQGDCLRRGNREAVRPPRLEGDRTIEAVGESVRALRKALENGVEHRLVGRLVKPVFWT